MSYKLWIDDVRDPAEWCENYSAEGWIWATSADQAKDIIVMLDFPEFMSIDHDMGLNLPTGMDFVKWLVEYDLEFDKMPMTFDFMSHSANPVGRQNIESYLRNYIREKFGYAD